MPVRGRRRHPDVPWGAPGARNLVACVQGGAHPLLDAIARGDVDQRTHLTASVRTRSDNDVGQRLAKSGLHFPSAGGMDEHASGSGALLAGDDRRRRREHWRDRGNVDIFKHQAAGLASELERQFFHRWCRGGHDLLSGGRRSGEADHIDVGRSHDVLACSVANLDHEVHGAGRQGRDGGKLLEHRDGYQRRLGGGLHDTGAPCGKRRSQRTNEQQDRPIPRHDDAGHSGGFAVDGRKDARLNFLCIAADGTRLPGVVTDFGDSGGDLSVRLPQDLSVFVREQLGQVRTAGFQSSGPG